MPYSIVVDREGHIFYLIAEYYSRIDRPLIGVSMYSPEPRKTATHFSSQYGLHLKKARYHGYPSEEEILGEEISAPDIEHLKQYEYTDPVTLQGMLLIPRNQIELSLNPFLSMGYILSQGDKNAKYCAELLDFLSPHGVPTDRIGLFGGLALGITPRNEANLHDIDIVVEGKEYHEAVVKLSRGNVVNYAFQTLIQSRRDFRDAAERRAQQSQFDHPIRATMKVDVRLIRSRSLERMPCIRREKRNEATLSGVVVDSSETLLLPARFVLSCDDIQYVVTTFLYHFIGCVRDGDRVEVCGTLIPNSGGALYVTSARTHYIRREQ